MFRNWGLIHSRADGNQTSAVATHWCSLFTYQRQVCWLNIDAVFSRIKDRFVGLTLSSLFSYERQVCWLNIDAVFSRIKDRFVGLTFCLVSKTGLLEIKGSLGVVSKWPSMERWQCPIHNGTAKTWSYSNAQKSLPCLVQDCCDY